MGDTQNGLVANRKQPTAEQALAMLEILKPETERELMKVTFDSNVWEELVSESSGYPTLREKILSRVIWPYLYQGAISLESIQKQQRSQFFLRYIPKVTVTEQRSMPDGSIDLTVQLEPNNSVHPGLSPILLEKLLKARDLEFKVLPMINIGTVRSLEIPKDMLATVESMDAYWAYAERSSNCSEFIETMGCGGFEYKNLKLPVTQKNFSRAVSEWVDGDALSAHYAFACDIFCTSDRGVGAGSRSIFHPKNLPKLKERFDIVVLSPEELATF